MERGAAFCVRTTSPSSCNFGCSTASERNGTAGCRRGNVNSFAFRPRRAKRATRALINASVRRKEDPRKLMELAARELQAYPKRHGTTDLFISIFSMGYKILNSALT